jgi:glycerol-3-phosphate acyltransferase PlsY
METAVALLAAYLVGSLPLGWLAVRGVTSIDLRHTGSGNVGATNAWRNATPALGVLVALLDAAKGATAVLLARRGAAPGLDAWAAVASVIGHILPVWLLFRGGKGVATASGAFALVAPGACVAAFVVFLVTVWRTRYVSLGSILGAVTLAAVAAWREPRTIALAALSVCLIILLGHAGNVRRLLDGSERRLTRHA